MMFGSKKAKTCNQLSFIADGHNPRLVFPAIKDGSSTFFKGRPIFDIDGPCQVEEMVISVDVKPTSKVNGISCKPKAQQVTKLACGIDLFAYNAHLAPTVNKPTIPPCH